MRQLIKKCALLLLPVMFVNSAVNAAATFSVNSGNDSLPVVLGLLDNAPSGLQLLGKSDDAVVPFTITGDGTQSGTWSYAGFDVYAVAIKAGPDFLLVDYTNDGPVSSDNWCTDASCSISGTTASSIPPLPELTVGRGNNPDLSHLSLYGLETTTPSIPEPATWLMMIIGFGLTGLSLKRRRMVA